MSKKIAKEAEFISESVICPCCGGIFFETTPQYNPNALVTPDMITLKEPYKGYGWAEVVLDGYMGHGALTCPECEGMISPDGKLRTALEYSIKFKANLVLKGDNNA